jgi:hypothetical protein
MAEILKLRASGLSRYSSSLSARRDGSLNEASNIVIDQEGIFSPRRGFSKLNGSLPNPARNLLPYDAGLLAYAYDTSSYKIFKFSESAGTFTAYTGFTSSNPYVRSSESNGNLYVTGSTGVYKLDDINEAIVEAGVPEALGGYGEVTGSAGFMPTNSVVAYRVVWGYKDANNNLVLGAPSNRIIVSNTSGGDRDVSLSFFVPQEITTDFFYQVYRTQTQSGATSDPGDTCFLILEDFYSPGSVVGGVIPVTDSTPNSLLGVELYTNATREGIESANYQPYKAEDITVFNNHMFYANLSGRQLFEFQLMSSSAINLGETITIAGQTYTAASSEDTANREFLKSGAGSPAVAIRETAESLVKCININTANTTVYAYYDSFPSELPGKIRIETRDFGAAAFTVQSAQFGDVCNPSIDTAKTSTAESFPNRLAFSKQSEPEAVPLTYWFDIGTKSKGIDRIISLRDSLFIFKGDGIWRLTGTSVSSFAVDGFDTSTKVLAPNTLCVLNNLVFGLFDQGVCKVSETGVEIISREFEGDLRGYIGTHFNTLSSLSFGFAYETDRKYFMWVPGDNETAYPNLGYVYNTITNTWTTFNRSAWCGVVNPTNDRIYMAQGGRLYLSKERKDANYSDYSDEQTTVTVTSVAGNVLTLDTTIGINVGDIFVADANRFSYITSVSISPAVIEVEDDLTWSVYSRNTAANWMSTNPVLASGVIGVESDTGKFKRGNGTDTWSDLDYAVGVFYGEARKQYSSVIEFNPVHANSPGHMKHWSECMTILTKDFRNALVYFKTEGDSGWESTTVLGTPVTDWGLFPWGEAPWGGSSDVMFGHRTYIPRTKQRASTIHVRMEINSLYTDWEVSGIELTYRDAGPRLLRR